MQVFLKRKEKCIIDAFQRARNHRLRVLHSPAHASTRSQATISVYLARSEWRILIRKRLYEWQPYI
jgi:hypothetical protein